MNNQLHAQTNTFNPTAFDHRAKTVENQGSRAYLKQDATNDVFCESVPKTPLLGI